MGSNPTPATNFMETCKFCGDRDLSEVPYGICFECGNHGPKYVETMWKPDYITEEEHKAGIERFRRNFCQRFRERGSKKCNCPDMK